MTSAYLTGSEVACGPDEVSAAAVPLRTVGWDSEIGYVVARLNAGGTPCWIRPGWMHGTGRTAAPLIARTELTDRLRSENAALRDVGGRLSAKVLRVSLTAASWAADDHPAAYWGNRLKDVIDPPGADSSTETLDRWESLATPALSDLEAS